MPDSLGEMSFHYQHTIGFLANQGRGFNNPIDVALDSKGVLYVLNRAGPEVAIRLPYKRVTICTVDEEYLGEFGTGGTGPGEFWWPSSLAFDHQDNLYVADEYLNRISIFSREGNFVGSWGEGGTSDGQLNRPSAIAFDAKDDLYITDSLNHRVQKFSRDGRFLSKWGRLGTEAGQFNLPWGIAFDRVGNIYVADWRNDRIQKFDQQGHFLAEWGNPGDGPGQLKRPAGLTVDIEGLIYVADWGNERVQVWSAGGEFIASLRGASVDSQWARDYLIANPVEAQERRQANLEPALLSAREPHREASASIEKLLWGPTAVKLDDQGRIYIVDSCRHRLQVYHKAPFH